MRTYDPTQQQIVFNGNIIDGYGPSTFIKVSRNEDGWSFQPSNSGGGARSRNPNTSGKFEFTLLAASPSNTVLSQLAVQDELSATGVGECQVTDRTTSEARCFAQNAWIVKHADFERQKELGEITWTIETDNLEIRHDGTLDV